MSINNDIRVRQNSNTRLLIAAIAILSVVVLGTAFSLSLIPSSAKAAVLPSWLHDHSWSNWNPHHTFNHNDNFDDSDDVNYTQCHNHLDDNENGTIDLKDPTCATVANDAPEALNGTLVTEAGVASSTTLGALDGDDDLLYFYISLAPQHGTLSGLSTTTAYTLDNLPVVTYTPEDGFVGEDSFDFRVNDGQEDDIDTDIGTISITVSAPAEPETPTCGENQYLNEDTNECVDNSVCGDNQTLNTDTHQCEDNAPQNNGGSQDSNTNTQSSNNGGGNGGGGVVSGPLSIGYVNTNQGTGLVLGTSTEATDTLPGGCSAYITTYLKKGATGSEVKKLQSFLNQNLGLTIPVSGIFGDLTFKAVSKFQQKYADEVLKPWFEKKLSSDMTPSGYAYKMTLYKINLLQCSTFNAPVPQLP